ncbi:major capsid protein [Microvirus sp.]|nr:major capsid protein [Microvirus sp.]
MVSIGRINIGRKEKRAFFPLNHDVETTSDFGFCQPTLVRQFIKGSKINLQTKTFVRLAALPCPTFGRIECKQHTAFVPITDVFEAFEYLQSNKAVSSALRSYIPTSTDYSNNIFLLDTLFHIMYGISSFYSTDFNKWLELLPFRLSLYVNSSHIIKANEGSRPTITELVDVVGRDTNFDIFNDIRIWGAESKISDDLRKILFGLGCHIVYFKLRDYLDSIFLASSSVLHGEINLDGTHISDGNPIKLPLGIFSYMYTDVYGNVGAGTKDVVLFGRRLINDPSAIPGLPTGTYNWLSSSQLIYTPTDTVPLGGSRVNSVKDSRNAYIFDAISAQNADMMFKFDGHTDYVYSANFTCAYTGDVSLGVHFTPNGKRIMKVLTACRIYFGRKRLCSNEKLYAYYKVWFDKYNAGRNLQWRDTNCYKLIHTFYDTGVSTGHLFYEPDDLPFAFTDSMFASLRSNWMHFILDLANCTYCSALDNITVATDSPILENTVPTGSDPLVAGLDSFQTGSSYNLPLTASTKSSVGVVNQNPYGVTSQTDGLSVRLLQTLYKLVNKNSVLGSKVDDYLRAHGIANGLPKSMVLGDQSFACGIDEVYGTVNNDFTALGEMAGKGIGAIGYDKEHPAKDMKFECDTFGYLIQLTTLVPIGGYVQAMGHDCISRYDFYQSEFDSLGMEVLPQSSVIGRQYCFGEQFKEDSVFGFVPRYFQLKVENNLANGGFSFPSEMANFLPYSLDRIITTGMPDDYINRPPEYADNEYNRDIVCDEELRYIGRYEKYGNFNRIFYDTTGRNDNFILHIVQNLTMYAPMRPRDNSFDTFDEFNDDNTVSLEHA